MATTSFPIALSDTLSLSGRLTEGARATGVGIVLAHGAGTDMNNPSLVAIGDGLAARGHAVVRFNFPYKELGRKAPDPMPKLEQAYRATVDAVRSARPDLRRLVLGGRSMGGRVASMIAAKGTACDGLVFLSYPLHTADPRKPMRDEHLPATATPMLFVQGTRDSLCDLDRLRPVLDRLGGRAALYVVEGGNHSLDVPKSSGRSRSSVIADVVTAVDAWIDRAVMG